MNEIETKILNVDVEETTKKIESFGAKLDYDAELRNHIYRKKGFKGFFRIREREGKVITTLKLQKGKDKDGLKQRDEREQEVPDFAEGERRAHALGFEKVAENTKHRRKYKLGHVVFLFDSVPGIPTYLEIESDNADDVYLWVEKLGFTREQMCSKGASQLMKEHGV